MDVPGSPVVKKLPSNTGDMGSISGLGAMIPHASGELRPRAAKDPAQPRKSFLFFPVPLLKFSLLVKSILSDEICTHINPSIVFA